MRNGGISMGEVAEQVEAVLDAYLSVDYGGESAVQALLDVLFEGIDADLVSWETVRREFTALLLALGEGDLTVEDAAHRIMTRIVQGRLAARPMAANDNSPFILISPSSPDVS